MLLAGVAPAFAQSAPAPEAAAPAPEAAASALQPGEIVVTAQRRSQNLQQIPYNITAVRGADLAKAGVSANSLSQVVPGLVTIDAGPASRGGANNYTLRGLRTDSPSGGDGSPQNVSSVSTYLGDVPVFFPMVFKDIDRVEVLRGPQGTLYGSGAEGGTIRFIPNRPNFDKLSGEFNATGGITEHSGKPNGSFDGVLNIPLGDTLAFRLVGGIDHQGGFIDDVDLLERTSSAVHAGVVSANPSDPASAPVIGPVKKDTNTSNQSFVRAELRWKPSDRFDFELDYTHQNTKVDDIQATNAGYTGTSVDFGTAIGLPNSAYETRSAGKYESTFPILEPYENSIDLVSGTASVDFGLATLTSVTSYYDNKTSGVSDTSNYYGGYTGREGFISYYANYPRFIAVTTSDNKDRAFTQELRLVSHWDLPIDYVVGGYFQHQKTSNIYNQVAPGIADFGTYIGQPSQSPDNGDQIYYIARHTNFKDRAVFGELTWHITPKWQVTGGVRFFWQTFDSGFVQESPFCGASCGDGVTEPSHLGIAVANNTSKVNDHIVKVNTSYDVTPGLKFYATYAEGFRRGGANGIPIAGYFRSLPQYTTYQPDFAKTYEVGVKGNLLDRKLQYSADLYLINLDNFQFTTSTPSYESGVFNGNQARSKGGEIELHARLTRNLSASLAYTYTDAKVSKTSSLTDYPVYSLITGAAPYVYLTLQKGAKLPGVPKHTINGSLDYTTPLGDRSLSFHVDGAYHSKELGAINPADTSFWIIPSAFTMNGRITLDSGKSWSADLFVNNITNEIGYSASVGRQNMPSSWTGLIVQRPRTVGVGLHYHF
ncbi:TonB-dependent receptor [Sphingomonas oryzagri]|uniref:TonB-dependent receptor n=1 Tax=Sphingomonas oryzagri TaxID=3042314 RepID=A0ABT6N1E7_9SPHN|nr:TonB-dependent receptor [Sphingomonas oryzagri]MDH7639120.1 TonB-dependent receptor [Sphingomonas oryzagri]